MSKKNEVALAPSQEVLDFLRQAYPVEPGFTRILLPRLGMVSQDVTEEVKNPKTGKKEIKIVTEAGEFFIDRETEETGEDGKKIWNKEELGRSIQATLVYHRKQLRYYDSSTKLYTSSPIYDQDDEVVPLFCDKKQVDRGLPADLQAKYPGLTAAGKPTSKLEVNRILYVLYKNELFQMTVRGTSMYQFLAYVKKGLVPSLLTEFSSESKENGGTAWNQMTFKTVRPLNAEEVDVVLGHVKEIKDSIDQEKLYYASQKDKPSETRPALNDGFGGL